MSTWTSDSAPARRGLVRRASLSALCLLLAGCVGTGIGPRTGDPVTRMSLYGGEVNLVAPPGYCIDDSHVRRGRDVTVVPLATCESLTGQVGLPVPAALMTVSVLPRQGGQAAPTADSIAASLAPVEALERADSNGVAYVRFADGGQDALPGGDPRHWRGGMMINGHLIGLAVYAPQGSALAGAGGRRLMADLAARLRRASPDLPDSVATAPQEQTEARPGGMRGLLGGLFRDSG